MGRKVNLKRIPQGMCMNRIGFLFYPEDRGKMLLRYVGKPLLVYYIIFETRIFIMKSCLVGNFGIKS
jgi:hypothetical protein